MAGIYIHIPFCTKQCSYCDFHFSTTYHPYRERMLSAIKREIVMRSKAWEQTHIETIYFGGGTPSILTSAEINQIISEIRLHYSVISSPEITLECNPGDCSVDQLKTLKEIGVNRLSLGIQSFDDQQLQWMNRSHNSSTAHQLIQDGLAAGFTVFNIDLIYGLPETSLSDWKKQLDIAFEYPIDHISAYCLTVERKTPLAKWVKEKKIIPVSEEEQALQFDFLMKYAEEHGFEQYEISNFARHQAYSLHNTSYWKGTPYLGIGPSAHGYTGKLRYWNVSNNTQYMTGIENNQLPEEQEVLQPIDQFNETIMIGLRTKWGVNKKQLFDFQTPHSEWVKQYNLYIKSEKLLENETHFWLSPSARKLADGIAADLFM